MHLVSPVAHTNIPLSPAAKKVAAHLASTIRHQGCLLCNQWLSGLSLGASLPFVLIGYVRSHACTLRCSVRVIVGSVSSGAAVFKLP